MPCTQALLDAPSGLPIGSVAFMAHAPEHFRVEVGAIWLTPAFRGRRLVNDVMVLLLTHLFDGLKYRWVGA